MSKSVLFAGARTYEDHDTIVEAMVDMCDPGDTVVSGDTGGFASMVEESATALGFGFFVVDETTHYVGNPGLPYPPNRDRTLVDEVDKVVTFGDKRATNHLRILADDRGISVTHFD